MTIHLERPAQPGNAATAATPKARSVELLLFTVRQSLVREADAAGMHGFIVDWERRGKARRQAGENTQINNDTYRDLVRVRASTRRPVLCRINGFGPWTRQDVERAIDGGADEILLPMVTDPVQVDETLAMVAGRCGLGILVETQAAVRQADELLRRPLSRVYVGLNDLRIDRGSTSLFAPLVDGTVDYVRSCAGETPFGVAGLTLPDRGHPVSSRLLGGELERLGASFTFLRRSFLADTEGAALAPGVAAIRVSNAALSRRSDEERQVDRQALIQAVPRDLAAA